MSAADHFKFHRPFPFCPGADFLSTLHIIDDLSLADVMDAFWNLESLQLNVTGKFSRYGTDLDMAGSVTLAPFAISGGYTTCTYFSESRGGAMFGPPVTVSDPGDFPAVLPPRERVCMASEDEATYGLICTIQAIRREALPWWTFACVLGLATDPGHAGRYRLGLHIIFVGQALFPANPSPPPFNGAGVREISVRIGSIASPAASGTTEVLGFSVPWSVDAELTSGWSVSDFDLQCITTRFSY